ncbi:MAG: hypothetical protein QOF72_1167 [Blastocatellia bacterium]|jgi:hypothetical protein|nr:hypothetical protein [Blastocatellia bacterium]MDX6575560.1 hypothetical protein [Blastocatellia bacterium]
MYNVMSAIIDSGYQKLRGIWFYFRLITLEKAEPFRTSGGAAAPFRPTNRAFAV